MITTSPEFQTAIDNNARAMYAEVRINYTDVTLDPNITATSTDENRVTWTDQAVNGRVDMTYKWLSCDGLNVLDGSFHPAPATQELANFNEFGWWGDDLGSATGVLDQTLTIEYTSRAVSGYYLAGDDKRGEYPVDFTVGLYNGVSLVYTDTVTGNTDVKYIASFAQQNNIDKAVLNITKWSVGETVVKIAEFTTQVIEVYSTDDLCDFNVIEQREISNNNSIPVGNISASQLALCLINRNRQFDANNTDSRLYGLVKPNVFVEVFIGCLTSNGIETIPAFKGWGNEWSVPEQDVTANLTARDRLELLTQTRITTSTVQTGLTFSDWFEVVLNDAGLTSTQYNIDTILDGTDYIVPYGWLTDVTHRRALEIIAQGCSAVVYVDREGLIQIKSIDSFTATVVKTFDRSDYTDKDNQPIYQNIANNITVKTQPLEKTTSVTVYQTLSVEPETVSASSTETVTIYYLDTPVSDHVATIDPPVAGLSITATNHYSWGSDITVQNTNGVDTNYQLKVVGSTYAIKGTQTAKSKDTASIEANGQQDFDYPTNQFLQKKVLAQNIADTLLASFKDPQRDLALGFNVGGDPSLELGDRIGVTDLYTTSNYYIIEQELNFDGGLSMLIKGRV